ncbi:hypothetical protein AWE51_25735 [Aquimarina aggregata]|uniref:Uncharacterized protein n=1 Tax=Aquimarina aggregata TaxID=1642818 RepID=A0A162Z228_9FLAO|nr:hypothetical protein [Aquimarina aggregata]KZS39505.1 hypothetical protein AWE51_25735 [Aquimarina aggregata]
MKPTTKAIISILENASFQSNLENLKASNATFSNQETTIIEVYNGMSEIRNLLTDSIENGTFEKLPFNQRNAINSQLTNVSRYATNLQQIIPQFNALETTIHNSRLLELSTESLDFEEKVKEVNSLRTRYKRLLKDIQDSEEIKKSIDEIKTKAEEDAQNISSISEKADELKLKYEQDEINISEKSNSITEAEQEIENRKKEILAFASNVEDNELKLNTIYDKLKDSIEKELSSKLIKVNSLIEEAENALELKQTEGIAKAYSSRLKKISDSNNKRHWLIGASVFVIITLLLGFLLTGGEIKIWKFDLGFADTENIGFIIGRIGLTFIGISGAVFCANRFVILRNLEEDYEYKVVLTKSILAFSNKIKEIDDSKVADYLTQVLDELHQDPLRSRKPEKSSKSDMDLDKIDKFLEIIKKVRPE